MEGVEVVGCCMVVVEDEVGCGVGVGVEKPTCM